MNENKIKIIFECLSHSQFRSRFHLSKKDLEYIDAKGINVIESHARDFIHQRLAPQNIPNDGHQTPMRGHPVFIAQHATATCCRGCLEKWHKIKKDKELSNSEINYIVEVIMTFIKREVNNSKIKQ